MKNLIKEIRKLCLFCDCESYTEKVIVPNEVAEMINYFSTLLYAASLVVTTNV